MKRKQAKRLINRLAGQLELAFKRIMEFQSEEKFGIEHTVLREQINATLTTLEILKDELPYPFLPIDFVIVDETVGKYRNQCSWLGWI